MPRNGSIRAEQATAGTVLDGEDGVGRDGIVAADRDRFHSLGLASGALVDEVLEDTHFTCRCG